MPSNVTNNDTKNRPSTHQTQFHVSCRAATRARDLNSRARVRRAAVPERAGDIRIVLQKAGLELSGHGTGVPLPKITQ